MQSLEKYTSEELIEATKGFDDTTLSLEHPLRKMVEDIWGSFDMLNLIGTSTLIAQELAKRLDVILKSKEYQTFQL